MSELGPIIATLEVAKSIGERCISELPEGIIHRLDTAIEELRAVEEEDDAAMACGLEYDRREHQAGRREFWKDCILEIISSDSPVGTVDELAGVADDLLAAFDARFPAPGGEA